MTLAEKIIERIKTNVDDFVYSAEYIIGTSFVGDYSFSVYLNKRKSRLTVELFKVESGVSDFGIFTQQEANAILSAYKEAYKELRIAQAKAEALVRRKQIEDIVEGWQ